MRCKQWKQNKARSLLPVLLCLSGASRLLLLFISFKIWFRTGRRHRWFGKCWHRRTLFNMVRYLVMGISLRGFLRGLLRKSSLGIPLRLGLPLFFLDLFWFLGPFQSSVTYEDTCQETYTNKRYLQNKDWMRCLAISQQYLSPFNSTEVRFRRKRVRWFG